MPCFFDSHTKIALFWKEMEWMVCQREVGGWMSRRGWRGIWSRVVNNDNININVNINIKKGTWSFLEIKTQERFWNGRQNDFKRQKIRKNAMRLCYLVIMSNYINKISRRWFPKQDLKNSKTSQFEYREGNFK